MLKNICRNYYAACVNPDWIHPKLLNYLNTGVYDRPRSRLFSNLRIKTDIPPSTGQTETILFTSIIWGPTELIVSVTSVGMEPS